MSSPQEVREAFLKKLDEGPYSGHQLCTLISVFFARCGVVKSSEEIWNYSPTGELSEVFVLGDAAESWLRATEITQEEADRLEESLRNTTGEET